MILFTKPILNELHSNGVESAKAIMRNGNTPDHKPVVKLFMPDGQATWLLTEFEIELDEDGNPVSGGLYPRGMTGRAFGLCDLGMGFPEIGYVDLAELRAWRGPLKLPVERDRSFRATKTLAEYAEEARQAGRIAA